METACRILHLEDDANDAELIAGSLEKAVPGLAITWVRDRESFSLALGRESFDLVLSDHGLPGWDAMEALALVRRLPDPPPFILVSGAIGEEAAVDAIRRGAADYVLKQHLGQLPPAVRRAVERKEARRAQAEQQRQLQEVCEALDEAAIVAATDLRGNIIHANDKFVQISGYSREELIGRNHRILKSGHHPPEFYRDMWRTITSGRAWWGEIQNRRKDGSRYWVSTIIHPVLDGYGGIKEYLSIRFDITALKETQAALESSLEERARQEQRYRGLFQRLPIAGYVYDADTLRIEDANEAALRQYGYSRDEFLGLSVKALRPARELARFEAMLQATAGIQPVPTVWEHQRRDGRPLIMEVISREYHEPGRNWRLVLARDITEERGLRDQVERSQRMELLGQMAGGVAHDFNNVLQSILGHLELLERRLPEDTSPQAGKHLHAMRTALDHGRSLVGQLRSMSAKGDLHQGRHELQELVLEVVELLRPTLGHGVRVEVQPAGFSTKVSMDLERLHQVLVNLMLNARDAMAGNGTLLFRFTRRSFDEAAGAFLGVAAGDFLGLEVRDTGSGIPLELQARIFEPFFTTKGDKGTGFGLSVAYTIMKSHGGAIRCSSEPGRGTTFELLLPLARRPSDAPSGPLRVVV